MFMHAVNLARYRVPELLMLFHCDLLINLPHSSLWVSTVIGIMIINSTDCVYQYKRVVYEFTVCQFNSIKEEYCECVDCASEHWPASEHVLWGYSGIIPIHIPGWILICLRCTKPVHWKLPALFLLRANMRCSIHYLMWLSWFFRKRIVWKVQFLTFIKPQCS